MKFSESQLREACETIYLALDLYHQRQGNTDSTYGVCPPVSPDESEALDKAFKALKSIEPPPIPPKDKLG